MCTRGTRSRRSQGSSSGWCSCAAWPPACTPGRLGCRAPRACPSHLRAHHTPAPRRKRAGVHTHGTHGPLRPARESSGQSTRPVLMAHRPAAACEASLVRVHGPKATRALRGPWLGLWLGLGAHHAPSGTQVTTISHPEPAFLHVVPLGQHVPSGVPQSTASGSRQQPYPVPEKGLLPASPAPAPCVCVILRQRPGPGRLANRHAGRHPPAKARAGSRAPSVAHAHTLAHSATHAHHPQHHPRCVLSSSTVHGTVAFTLPHVDTASLHVVLCTLSHTRPSAPRVCQLSDSAAQPAVAASHRRAMVEWNGVTAVPR